MIRGAALLAALAACGGGRTTTPVGGGRDAGDAGVSALVDAVAAPPDAAAARAGTAAGYQIVDTAHAGTVRAAVVWPDAPAAVRRSPGRTACGTPRPARARIATLFGVADAVVVLDVAAGKPPPPAAAVRLIVRDCAVTPPVIVAPGLGGALEVQQADEVARVAVMTALGPAWQAAATPAPVARAALPVLGHTVAVPLDTPGAIAVALDGAGDDAAYAIAPPHPYVAVTDADGAARFDDVPPGDYAVHAWLPPRAGAAAIAVTGRVTVTADADAAVTLTLASPAAP